MSAPGYDILSRHLHRIALQSKAIAEISFNIENILIKKEKATSSARHVFVTGLARSGTTILMQHLHDTGHFRSLTYLDMPFVLMPNIWKRISYKKSSSEYTERAHKDKIMVSFDSPEAFEEVFWKTFCEHEYICADRLQLHHIDDETLKKFQHYVNNILFSSNSVKQTLYLSKNNNNVLRLQQIQQSLPNAQIIVPFRDPLQHSISLLNQHTHFSKIHKESTFSLNYMNWLGHFEFGLNQKPFFLNNEKYFQEMQAYDKADINFWLINWKNYYDYINTNPTQNTIFFNYEKLCQQPSLVMGRLFDKLNITAPQHKIEPFKLSQREEKNFDKNLLTECYSIYTQLQEKFGQWFD